MGVVTAMKRIRDIKNERKRVFIVRLEDASMLVDGELVPLRSIGAFAESRSDDEVAVTCAGEHEEA